MTDVPLSSLLDDFLKENKMEAAFDEHTAAARFSELLSETMRPHIQKVWAERGQLFVKCDSAVVKFELLNRRSEWLQQLNAGFAETVIKEIVVL